MEDILFLAYFQGCTTESLFIQCGHLKESSKYRNGDIYIQ